MSKPTPPAYKTRNWPAYNEALKRRGSLTIWFDPAKHPAGTRDIAPRRVSHPRRHQSLSRGDRPDVQPDKPQTSQHNIRYPVAIRAFAKPHHALLGGQFYHCFGQ